ncbi:hypothetical protein [Candidatus Formimonas warabiya]|uniref:hypothetical protein n=1 Tax=Formimonas warabiya TaxID=1761012 RepID=UPI001BE45046|nr:hypothetical protein [Candidatus Formimonas warabiya]
MTKKMQSVIISELDRRGIRYGIDSTGALFFEDEDDRERGMKIIAGIMGRR